MELRTVGTLQGGRASGLNYERTCSRSGDGDCARYYIWIRDTARFHALEIKRLTGADGVPGVTPVTCDPPISYQRSVASEPPCPGAPAG
jgi:hypothetical protein